MNEANGPRPGLVRANPAKLAAPIAGLVARGLQLAQDVDDTLHRAAWGEQNETVRLLISAGADVNAPNKWGETPLYCAVRGKNIEGINLLLAAGATPTNCFDAKGCTLLHFAAVYGLNDVVKLLLAAGADPDTRKKDDNPCTPLHWVCFAKAIAGTELLTVIDTLLDYGADIEARDSWEYIPLHWAVGGNRADIVAHLLKKGADINARANLMVQGQVVGHMTPLEKAKIQGFTDIVALLSKHGEEVETSTRQGNAYFDKGEYDKAVAAFSKAIELNPRDWAYTARARAYAGKGDFDKAIGDSTKAIRLNPQFASSYFIRGVAHERKGDFERAGVDYSKAIELDPQNANAFYGRAVVSYHRYDYDLAIVDYTATIQLNPQYAPAYSSRAAAYAKNGQIDLARADVNQCQTLGGTVDPQLLKDLENSGDLDALFQNQEFVNYWVKQGERTLGFLKNARPSTVFLEFAHMFFQTAQDDISLGELGIFQGTLETLCKWRGIRMGDVFTVAYEKAFANAFERYVRDGKTPSTELANAFTTIRDWFRKLYRNLIDNSPGIAGSIPDDVRDVFNTW